MGTSRNGRCELAAHPAHELGLVGLQWGPPGMGGVSNNGIRNFLNEILLQWGPPGMGGVSDAVGASTLRGLNTSMGTSRNGRCEVRRPRGDRYPGPAYFNGDLPEWEV